MFAACPRQFFENLCASLPSVLFFRVTAETPSENASLVTKESILENAAKVNETAPNVNSAVRVSMRGFVFAFLSSEFFLKGDSNIHLFFLDIWATPHGVLNCLRVLCMGV